MKLRQELVDKINVFNKIFELDFVNSNQEKNWKYYLDRVAKHLFNVSYITFMKTNSLALNSVPGSFENYYNLFQKIIHDYKNLLALEIPNQIYCASVDIINDFNNFLVTNKYKIIQCDNRSNNSNLIYQIYPTI